MISSDHVDLASTKEEHREFQELFARLGRKVTRLERSALEYVNDGAPKRLRQEFKHCSYLFSSTLGSFPKNTEISSLMAFVKKMKRFKDTSYNLLKTCE